MSREKIRAVADALLATIKPGEMMYFRELRRDLLKLTPRGMKIVELHARALAVFAPAEKKWTSPHGGEKHYFNEAGKETFGPVAKCAALLVLCVLSVIAGVLLCRGH